MNRNYLDQPYTALDADRFKTAFSQRREVEAPEYGKKQATNFQKGDGKIALSNLKMIIKDVRNIYAEAHRMGGSNFQVQELGRFVAYECQSTMIPGPIKSHLGAFKKMGLAATDEDKMVKAEDRYSSARDLKDIVRVTIVGESEQAYQLIVSKLLTTCTSRYNMSIRKNAQIFPDKDPCGYSGANIVAVLPCMQMGELQVNNRAIMFGKMSQSDYCRDLNVTVDAYHASERTYGIEGGLGHTFYEIYRDDKTGLNGREAARLSTIYYASLRKPSTDAGQRMQFRRALDALKVENKGNAKLHWPPKLVA